MLRVDHLSKTYADGTQALIDLSLALEEGEIVALLGGSGCGKSTLIRLIAGLDAPTQGTISIGGSSIASPSRRIGVVFQEPRLLPWLTVAGNIAFGVEASPAAERVGRVERALESIGLPGYGPRWPRELSGGQAQRISLARALVPRPEVLLMDEPFSALDPVTRRGLHDQLLALWAERRPTLLVATHDIDEAVMLADRVVVMRPHPGRIGVLVTIDLPRPRRWRSPDFDAAAARILGHLQDLPESQRHGA